MSGGVDSATAAARAVDAGHEVTGLDDLSTGRLENLAAVTPHPRFRLVLARA